MAVRKCRLGMTRHHLIQYELILNAWNMKFGNLRFWKNASVPFFKFPAKNGFEKSYILEQLSHSKSVQAVTLVIF